MTPDASPLAGFTLEEFSHGGSTRPVHRAGSGPPVIVMHEIPGITPQVADFARRVVEAGFTVFLPVLFGHTGQGISTPYMAREMTRACIGREFSLLAARRASPITSWLRALSRRVHDEFGGAGVGAVGMCITGNFALTLMVDPWLMAPVLSQPSLPIPLPGGERRSALHMSDEDLATARRRSSEEGVCVLALRFTGDRLCPQERFDRLRQEFGERFEGIGIDSGPGNAAGFAPTAHSVITTEFVDEEGHPTKQANDRVIGFLQEALIA